ncbi:DEAD/DEAH box helicase [Neobacillus terrae]|uniref:DEAD/DEAH box helicase n=1 Tax=Neobacillus terrae TaxID=3034837 RepID=UPI00140E71F0|nr:DEAD/DEAH box helicase [Neobacillus terrae]NHM31531.1 DEAD/DEAH box helicase [Neobacillus terrae]
MINVQELKPFLKEAWEKSGFEKPTSIQNAALPVAMEGKDIIAESPTGTGKTLAYLFPVLQSVDAENQSLQAVVLASSQELVMQVYQEFQKWSEGSGLRGATLIGGANLKRQLEKIKKRPQVIFGTPGRVNELIKQKKLKMHEVKTLVLDEGDQLLTKEHTGTTQSILKSTQASRQVLIFSATLKKDTEKLARELTNEPEVIRINREEEIPTGEVEHIYFSCEPREKVKLLEKIARLENIKTLAFVNDISEITVAGAKLQFKELSVGLLHSELDKMERQSALRNFRDGKLKMLIATDVAARGLDIQGITHVVHIDMPKDINQYVHRSGRTGRMGANGTVISLVTEREERELKQYCRNLEIPVSKRIFFKGQIANENPNKR